MKKNPKHNLGIYYKFIWGNIDQICKKHFKENLFLYFRHNCFGVFFFFLIRMRNEELGNNIKNYFFKDVLDEILWKHTNTIGLISENIKFYHVNGILFHISIAHLNADFDEFSQLWITVHVKLHIYKYFAISSIKPFLLRLPNCQIYGYVSVMEWTFLIVCSHLQFICLLSALWSSSYTNCII